MFIKRLIIIILMFTMAVAACGAPEVEPGSAQQVTPEPQAEEIAAQALPAARTALAAFLGVDADALELATIEDAEWRDSCLGLGGPAESCLQVIVPGFAITFNVNGEQYTVRTDDVGNSVRVEEPQRAEDEQPAAVQAAIDFIAAEMAVASDAVELMSWHGESWPNACLGLADAGEMCAEVITPGYLVVVRAADRVFNIRTDESGQTIRLLETADPATELPATAIIARQALATELGVDAVAIEVISFERTEWSDSCLGLGGPAESCLAAITPGWKIMLALEGTAYEVRTDEFGDSVRIAGPQAGEPGGAIPGPELGDAVLFYQRSGGIAGEIVTVRIFADGSVERMAGRHAASDAVELYMVDPAAVETLLADLQAAGYADLDRYYVPDDTCCDRILYLTAALIDGETHVVEALDATEGTPQAVWDSIAVIEAFVDEAIAQ